MMTFFWGRPDLDESDFLHSILCVFCWHEKQAVEGIAMCNSHCLNRRNLIFKDSLEHKILALKIYLISFLMNSLPIICDEIIWLYYLIWSYIYISIFEVSFLSNMCHCFQDIPSQKLHRRESSDKEGSSHSLHGKNHQLSSPTSNSNQILIWMFYYSFSKQFCSLYMMSYVDFIIESNKYKPHLSSWALDTNVIYFETWVKKAF